MRGFGDSDEPTEITAYSTIKLREDIANLVKALSIIILFIFKYFGTNHQILMEELEEISPRVVNKSKILEQVFKFECYE